jgi:hypothetical protein
MAGKQTKSVQYFIEYVMGIENFVRVCAADVNMKCLITL